MDLDVVALDLLPATQRTGLYPCQVTCACTRVCPTWVEAGVVTL
ncbi:hypothetical protein [Nonomuraea sp. NPDC050783]